MAAYAALVSLLNTIEQMMTHPRLSISFDNNQIQSLQEKAALLLDFIETHNYGGGGSEEAQHLESLIESAAHTAEDMIESHIVNQLLPLSADDGEAVLSFSLYLHKKGGIEEQNETAVGDLNQFHGESNQAIQEPAPHVAAGDGCWINFMQLIVNRLKRKKGQLKRKTPQTSLQLNYLRQIIEDMNAIIEKANELKEKQRFREDQPPTHSIPQYTQTGEESGMVGFHDEMIQLLDQLTGHRSNRQIISIVGMGGMGKTTLAKSIYANQLIIEHFDIRAWATVSQQYNAKQILEQLLSSQGKSSDKSVDELGEQLHKTLSGRRYLIILDDIWSVEAWNEVRCFFPYNGSGSRILLTTRLSDVANNCGSSCFPKNLLDEKESWELFCKKAFQNEDCPTELEKVGREIVRLCKGLALSIVVIGGSLLKSPRTVGYWKNVAKDIELSPNSKEKQESLDVLFSSYNHLPPHLKPCFLHIGVLKHINYANLNILSIIQLWVAEGFLKSNGGRVLEEIAEDYLKELVDRNLILVGRQSKNGKMKCCDIHDLLRDLCLKVAEQQGFFHVHTQGPVLGAERRLTYYNGTVGRETATPLLARSIMEFVIDKQECYKHRLLRIWHARSDTAVEESLNGCVNLRYLALLGSSYRVVLELPSSVSLVWNLQALIFGEYSYEVVAPIEIWKMRQLRHIECRRIYLPHPDGQDELLILENLQRLGKSVNLRLSEDVCKIIPNIKKLNLEYNRELQGYDNSLIECLCNLDRLHKLESLKLCSEISWGFWGNMHYKLNEILAFPSSLNKLTLKNFNFDWEDLTMIGSLPLLEVLNLECNYFGKGSTWSPVNGQFQRLKFLKIDKCKLRCWNADSCHFPNLEKLLLYYLFELEEIPWGIGEIQILKLIQVYICSNSAAISALKIKDEQLECRDNDDLQIQVDVPDQKLQSFMAMLETEGLTLNNVQFNNFLGISFS